jgi:hypothetical protein
MSLIFSVAKRTQRQAYRLKRIVGAIPPFLWELIRYTVVEQPVAAVNKSLKAVATDHNLQEMVSLELN